MYAHLQSFAYTGVVSMFSFLKCHIQNGKVGSEGREVRVEEVTESRRRGQCV